MAAWIQLPTISKARFHGILSNICIINESEFIIAMNKNKKYNSGIYKYNIRNNTWELLIKSPYNVLSTYSITIAFNPATNQIYLNGFQSGLIKINLNTKNCKHIDLWSDFGGGSSSLIIDEKYHLIGGSTNGKHIILNGNGGSTNGSEPIDMVNRFHEGTLAEIQAVYVPSQTTFFVFGGSLFTQWDSERRSNAIWTYTNGTKEWIKLDTILPFK
eukprot:263062_1